MEATAQSVEDYLIDGLTFKLQPGASYITNRRSVTYFPHGGNTYSATGVKVIKLMLTGSDWLDPSTVKMQFDLLNLSTSSTAGQGYLTPIGGPWSFFRRLRILCGGQVVEDIDYYNHCHEMIHVLMPAEVRANHDAEGFGNGLVNPSSASTLAGFTGIPPGSWSTVSFKFLSGLLNQDKFLPIRQCPITIEIELVNQATDPVIALRSASTNDQIKYASSAWQIQNVQIKADLVTLDNSLDNEYAQHLLEGKSLPVSYNTYVSQYLTIQSSGGSFTTNVTRSFTRLKSVFVTAMNRTLINSGGALFTDLARDWNYMYHPLAQSLYWDPSQEMELQIQVGSKLFPEYACKTTREAYSQLKKCLGIQGSTWHAINISEAEYRKSKFVFGIDTEKMLQAGFTGLNTKAGDLMTIRSKCLGTTANVPDSMFVILHSDQILNIRDTGVEIME